MPVCQKCNIRKKGVNGLKAAIILIPGSVPVAWLFGFPNSFLMIGLGLYALTAHHPSSFVCQDCAPQTCPDCSEDMATRNLCKPCRVVVCPYCGNHQSQLTGKKRTDPMRVLAFIGFILLAIICALTISPWLLAVFYLFYVYFSSPRCTSCNARISTSNF